MCGAFSISSAPGQQGPPGTPPGRGIPPLGCPGPAGVRGTRGAGPAVRNSRAGPLRRAESAHRSIIWLVILRVAALVGLRMKTKSIVNFTWFLRYVGIGRQIRVRNGGKPLGPDPCPWWMSPPLARDHGLIAPSCTLVHGCDTRRHNRLGKLPHQWDY